ncbi:MAG: hypothetical protein ACRDVC_03255 [Acidimicrobiales bacterium]
MLLARRQRERDAQSAAHLRVDGLGEVVHNLSELRVCFQALGEFHFDRLDLLLLSPDQLGLLADGGQRAHQVALRAVGGRPHEKPDVELGDGGHQVQGKIETRRREPGGHERAALDLGIVIEGEEQDPGRHQRHPDRDVGGRAHAVADLVRDALKA